MLPGAELLIDPPYIGRAAAWMASLAGACPRAQITSHYTGKHRLLVLCGAGRPERARAVSRHRAAGGRVAMWDIGYWDRNRSMRLSIDRHHPSPEHIAACAGREARPRPQLSAEPAFDPRGPILLCGLGAKSCVHLGLQPYAWERRKVEDLQIRHPGRVILHRPKPGAETWPRLDGTKRGPIGTIEQAMWGCSLVVCRHSNVAIDACIAGIPVETDDGAALALYRDCPSPSEDARREFLARLAWWNWGEHEAAGAWEFMEEMTQ